MTYALAAPLQAAVFARLSADPTLTDIPVFDAPPPGKPPEIYISLGPEDVRDRSDTVGTAAQHRFSITIIGSGGGFQRLKETAAFVEQTLGAGHLEMSRGHVALMRFERATARRDRNGTRRRVEMTFRALLDNN